MAARGLAARAAARVRSASRAPSDGARSWATCCTSPATRRPLWVRRCCGGAVTARRRTRILFRSADQASATFTPTAPRAPGPDNAFHAMVSCLGRPFGEAAEPAGVRRHLAWKNSQARAPRQGVRHRTGEEARPSCRSLFAAWRGCRQQRVGLAARTGWDAAGACRTAPKRICWIYDGGGG
jgi:hypothetical protein